jgi:hypothetical protein
MKEKKDAKRRLMKSSLERNLVLHSQGISTNRWNCYIEDIRTASLWTYKFSLITRIRKTGKNDY